MWALYSTPQCGWRPILHAVQ